MRFLEFFANPALRYELRFCETTLRDVTARSVAKDRVIEEQAELIRQFRSWAQGQPDPLVKPCLCLDRWRFWAERGDGGPDEIPNNRDDDPVPNP